MLNKLKSNKYFINSNWLFLEKIYRFIIGFFVSTLVIRYLGPTNFGILSYIQSIVSILAVFVSLGLDAIVLKEMIKNPDKKYLYLSVSIISRFLVSLGIVFVIFIIQKYILNNSNKCFLLWILSLGLFFESFSILKIYFQEKILSKYEVIANLISLTIGALLKIYLLINSYELIYFVVVIVFEKSIYALSLYIFFKKQESSFRFGYDKEVMFDLLKNSWPLIFSTLSYIIYTRTDQIMIEHFLGSYEVGIYSAAVRLYELPFIVTTIISGTLTPVLYRKFNENKKEFFDLTLKILSYMSLFAYAIVAVYIFYGKEIILLLFGDKYMESYKVLMILSFIIIVMLVSFLRSGYIILINNQTKLLYINIIMIILNVLLNIILYKIYSFMGIVYATLITRVFSFIYFSFYKDIRPYVFVQVKALLLIGLFKKGIK